MAQVLLSPSHIGSNRLSYNDEKRHTASSRSHNNDGTDTDIDDDTIEDESDILANTTREIDTTNNTTHSTIASSEIKATRRTGIESKRERPKSSFLDSPTNSLPKNLVDFLKMPKPSSPKFAELHTKNHHHHQPTANGAASSPLIKKPFRNLTNLMNTFKKGLTRHTTVGVTKHDIQDEIVSHIDDYDDNAAVSSSVDEDEYDLESPQPFHEGSPFNSSSPPNSPTRSSKPTPTSSIKQQQQQMQQCTIRRIHSMYHTEKEKPPVSMENNSILAKTTLKHFKVDNDLLPRIDEDSMRNILLGKHSKEFDEIIIIDSRFQYEYDGGHINGAINISSQHDLEDRLIKNAPMNSEDKTSRLVVFHCEFSIFRGPTMASHLRKCDRILNASNYPKLTYPDIVILEGGYKKFYDKYKLEHCHPQAYVEMKDINYQKACETEMHKVRQANKLTRAKSYNQFSNGQQQPQGQKHVSTLPQVMQRPRSFQHHRSSSYTTVTSHSENLKILKRQKSINKLNNQSQTNINEFADADEVGRSQRSSTFSYSQSIFNSTSSPTRSQLNSPPSNGFSTPVFPNLDSDSSSSFQPPSAIFRSSVGLHNRRSYNNLSSSSINSYSSISDQASAFSSTDSLTESYSSPTLEFTDMFASDKVSCPTLSTYLKHSTSASILNPSLAKKPASALPQAPARERGCGSSSAAQPPIPVHQFKFPQQSLKTKNSRNRLNNNINNNSTINHNNSNSGNYNFGKDNNSSYATSLSINTSTNSSTASLFNGTSSPLISSPLSTITPASDSARISNISSIIDPINDTPVDFSVPTKHSKHSRRRSGSFLSSGCYNYIALDIHEIDEEDDNEGDGTLTDIKLMKNPFN